MGTREERDHVGQRQVPSSETSFRQGGDFEAEAEAVDGDVDLLNKDVASGAGAQQSMAMQEVTICKVLRHEKSEPLSYRLRKNVEEDQEEEGAAGGHGVTLGDVHES